MKNSAVLAKSIKMCNFYKKFFFLFQIKLFIWHQIKHISHLNFIHIEKSWNASLFNLLHVLYCKSYTVSKEIDFLRYNMKCSGKNVILRGLFHVVSCFPLHFMLNRGHLDHFSGSVYINIYFMVQQKGRWSENLQ